MVELQVVLQAAKGARVSFGSSLKHRFPAKLSTAPIVHHTELLSAIWDNNKTLFNDWADTYIQRDFLIFYLYTSHIVSRLHTLPKRSTGVIQTQNLLAGI